MDQAEVRLRLAALDQAVKVVVAHEANASNLIDLAQEMYDWLTVPPPPVSLALEVGEIHKQNDPEEPTPVQIHDDEQFTLTVQAKDAKGFDVTDANLSWSVDDSTVATLQVSDDNQSAVVVAGNPGSAVVTLTDGNLTVTEAVDVVPGGVALITLAEGTVEKQPAATAPQEPTAPADGTAPAAPADGTTTTDTTAPVADANPSGDSAI